VIRNHAKKRMGKKKKRTKCDSKTVERSGFLGPHEQDSRKRKVKVLEKSDMNNERGVGPEGGQFLLNGHGAGKGNGSAAQNLFKKRKTKKKSSLKRGK